MKKKVYPTRFSFGGTSAIITSLALITGLNTSSNAKINILSALLVIALADNLSDALGIHIYQEAEGMSRLKVWISTMTNFLARLLVSLGFLLQIYFLPIRIAVISSVVYGLLTLSIISYIIAKDKKTNQALTIIEHIFYAIVVIFLSHYFGGIIISKFK